MIEVRFEDLEETLKFLQQLETQVPEVLGEGVESTGRIGVEGAQLLTPVKTGSMKQAWIFQRNGATGAILIDPNARNTQTGELVSSYSGFVIERLGIIKKVHSTVESESGVVLEQGVDQWIQGRI